MIARIHHFLTSVVNSGCVTVCTSLAMTYLNNTLTMAHWLPNWLISWAIVCTYVYFIAPRISDYIRAR